jgi:hypothetical protein
VKLKQLHEVQFCIIVVVIIAYEVGIGRITVNDNVKCDVKNESESMLWDQNLGDNLKFNFQ